MRQAHLMSRRRVKAARWLAVAAAITIGLATVALAPISSSASPSAAKKPSTTLLISSELKVRSSTGKQLYLQVEADRFSYQTSPRRPVDTSAIVSLRDNAGESHDWLDQVGNKSFRFDPKARRGSMRVSNSQLGELGAIDFAVASRGHQVATHECANGESWTRQHVTITGTVFFDTRSQAWGQVGSRHDALTFKGRSAVETDYGNPNQLCRGNGLQPCAANIYWRSPTAARALFSGRSIPAVGAQRGEIQFFIGQTVGRGRVIRNDRVLVRTRRPPTITSHSNGTKTVTVRAGTSGLATGSVTLTSTGPATKHGGFCSDGRTKTWPASYANGRSPLTVHMQIGGTITTPDRARGASISLDPS